MRDFLKQSLGILVVLAAVGCGSDDTGSSNSSESTGGTGTSSGSAGKTATSGSTSTARGGTGATTTAGTTGSTAHAGTSGGTRPASGGKGGTGGKSAAVNEEDAGVAASGGSGAHAAGGGGGSAGHAGGGGPAAGSGGSSAAAATFTEVYGLLSNGCAGAACHINATTPGAMLSFPDKATAYKNLVNADAVQCRGEKRVVPGDPTKSELVASLKHIQVGSCTRTPRMPDNMPQWKDSDIAIVSSWIQAGAQDN